MVLSNGAFGTVISWGRGFDSSFRLVSFCNQIVSRELIMAYKNNSFCAIMKQLLKKTANAQEVFESLSIENHDLSIEPKELVEDWLSRREKVSGIKV